MTIIRVGRLLSALTLVLLWATQVSAQAQSGTVTGQVVDVATDQPLSGASVLIEGTGLGTLTRADGGFLLSGVPAGTHTVQARLIGYGAQDQEVTVTAGEAAAVQFALQPEAVAMEEVVVTGYGTQRRESVTGSVATIDADEANVGVVSNANEMIQGRVAGVNITPNSGEPGSGVQIRIRGGTSISASNEPLYVIDGVPIENVPTEARAIDISGGPGTGTDGGAPLQRSPLNMLNPSDIESITILKDAAATAIYGSRAANGVVLIQTKRGIPGQTVVEYDAYAAFSAPASYLDVLTGDEYRQFIQNQVEAGNLGEDRLEGLGPANTDWERELTRTALTHNHNLAFTGGGESTQYRASLNYMDQEGVVLDNGFERIQGRLNASHQALDERLRLGLNLTASHLIDDFLPFENTGGFEGGVFTNMVNFNPTQPVMVTDPVTDEQVFYELGPGVQSVRNPVALAEQVDDLGNSTRTLGNLSAALDLVPGLTANLTVGADRSESTRRTYFPRSNPVGAQWEGRARQVTRENTAITLQSYLTLQRRLAEVHAVDLVGGYEFSEYSTAEHGANAQGFLTDALGFHNLSGGRERTVFSFRNEHRLVSFFSRGTYSYNDRYVLTGVLRYDGSSRFGEGNKWALFPAVSASWNISQEPFMSGGLFSDLRLRAGYGLQGNPAVPPYASLILLETTNDARYVFGNQVVTGVVPTRNPNPDLKWEETSQFNVALDYGLMNNRVTGTIEYYTKTTTDLLLEVPVPQPALVATRLENIGEVKNEGLELSMEAVALTRPDLTWLAGLVFSTERNEVVDLGGRTFITTGGVSGQGQSGQVSQRIMPGHPLGTFFGPVFDHVEVDEGSPNLGKQLFRCDRSDADCVNGLTTTPRSDDYRVLGNANPDFSLGVHSQLQWGSFDASFLVRSEVGRDVFNNTALVYATKGNALQDKNFLASALNDPTGILEPSIFSSRWIEDGSFVRLQNLTLGYTFDMPSFAGQVQSARVYVSGDNLFLITDYSGYDPEVHTEAGLASRGIDYLSYPRPRTFTTGVHITF